MTTSFAIALAQLNPRLGDVAGNCERLAKARGEAAKNGAAVIVTPEMYLSGYPCDDLVLRDDFMGDVAAAECSGCRADGTGLRRNQAEVGRSRWISALPCFRGQGRADR